MFQQKVLYKRYAQPFEDKKVEEAGIEPATCRMQSDHSTPELHPLLFLCTAYGDL